MLIVNAVLPLVVTFLLNIRAGTVWWLIGLSSVLILAIGEGFGLLSLADNMAGKSFLADTVTSLLIPTATFSVAAVFEWSRDASQKAVEKAMRQHVEAEKALVMMQADKMASVGLLAAGVGHEINNPLTYVKANIEFVAAALNRDEDLDREQLADAISDALNGVSRIARITSDLSTFARSDPNAEVEAVSLEQAANTALSLTRHELDHRASVHVQFTPLQPVLAIESRLVQILVNLLLNAAHAVEEQKSGEVLLRTGQSSSHTWLEVSDNGPGVSPELREKIFDPFFTTKKVGSGTGLGLSTSRSLAHAMGGTLQLHSPAGSGAVFRLSFPLTSASISPVEKAPTTQIPQRYRFLVIDDELMFERAITRMLDPHEVLWFPSGEAALEHIKQDDRFDLILSDVMMNPMPGWEVLQHIQQHHPKLERCFVFMTGGAFTPTARMHVQKANVSFLQKPFELSDVIQLVNEKNFS